MSVNMGVVSVKKTTQDRIKRRDHCDCRRATFTTSVTDYIHNPQEVMGFVNIVNVVSFLFQKKEKREKPRRRS